MADSVLQRNRRYSTQKEMITAECTRNIEMAKNQFEQQSAGSACAGRVHEPWVGLQAFVDGFSLAGVRLWCVLQCRCASREQHLKRPDRYRQFRRILHSCSLPVQLVAYGFLIPQTTQSISAAARRCDQAIVVLDQQIVALDQQHRQQGPLSEVQQKMLEHQYAAVQACSTMGMRNPIAPGLQRCKRSHSFQMHYNQ